MNHTLLATPSTEPMYFPLCGNMLEFFEDTVYAISINMLQILCETVQASRHKQTMVQNEFLEENQTEVRVFGE